MYHDLVEREQGRGQSEQLPVAGPPAWAWAALVLVALALGAGLVVRAARGAVPAPAPPTAPIVLLSGRDDHGLLAQPFVTLAAAPNSPQPLGRVRDGTFMRVLEQRGTWMQVQMLAAPYQTGWVDDFYLRGRALRGDGQGQVIFVDARVAGGQLEIAVRPVERPDGEVQWLAASLLHEVGALRTQNPALER